MDNNNKWDYVYPGIEVLPKKPIISTTCGYRHWIDGEEPFIVSVCFKFTEIEQNC